MKRNSIIIWGGLILLLIGSAVLSALWPSISAGMPSGEVSAPTLNTETEPIHLAVPPIVPAERIPAALLSEDGTEFVLNPFIALGVLTAVMLGGIVVIGGGLAFLYTRLDSMNKSMVESESFKNTLSGLEAKEKERLKAMNAEREIISKSEEEYAQPRWSVFSTGTLILLFVTFIAAAISDTVFPDGEMFMGDQVLNAHGIFIAVAVLVTLLILITTFRPRTLAFIEGEETASIPWDIIFLLITGFVMIVVGTGLIFWLQ